MTGPTDTLTEVGCLDVRTAPPILHLELQPDSSDLFHYERRIPNNIYMLYQQAVNADTPQTQGYLINHAVSLQDQTPEEERLTGDDEYMILEYCLQMYILGNHPQSEESRRTLEKVHNAILGLTQGLEEELDNLQVVRNGLSTFARELTGTILDSIAPDRIALLSPEENERNLRIIMLIRLIRYHQGYLQRRTRDLADSENLTTQTPSPTPAPFPSTPYS